jgi:protein-S-isoprenylcysteine O-methyltransferase Ste14
MAKPTRVLPPVYFLVALASTIALHHALPVARVVPSPYVHAGWLLVVAGVVLVLWCAFLFRRAGTAIKPFRESSALITNGPYRWTRNPIYAGMVIALAGVCVVLGTLAPFVVVPAFVCVIRQRFIRVEEGMLEQTFGAVYLDYRRRVRRWI